MSAPASDLNFGGGEQALHLVLRKERFASICGTVSLILRAIQGVPSDTVDVLHVKRAPL
jgi:hypothetical protein